METAEVRLPWLSIAPFGSPVVPPVYCSSATSSMSIADHCAGFVAPSMNWRNVMIAELFGSGVCGVPTLPQSSSSQTIRRSSRPLSRNFSAVGNSAERLLVTSTRAPESESLCDCAIPAIAGAQEGAGCDFDPVLQFGVADRPVAKFDRRTRAEVGRRLR